MIDIDDYKAFRDWQARNRRTLYIYGGAFTIALLAANLYPILRG